MKQCGKKGFGYPGYGAFVMLIVFFCLFLIAQPGLAADFVVTNTNNDGPGSLRVAIDSADSYEDVISFQFVSYPQIISLDIQLSIENGLKIQGPGADMIFVSGNDSCRVFYIDTSDSVDISGISIISGDAGISYGGGMYNFYSSPTVTDCAFIGNRAKYGAGMYNEYEGSNPVVTDCIFTRNIAEYEGGGMYNYDGSIPTVTGCTFTENKALNSYGGGMFNQYSSPVVTECLFIGNEADQGGGMSNRQYSDPEISNCIFSENIATDEGGGMQNYFSCNPTVNNCTFDKNEASYAGGMGNDNADPEIIDCIFSENIATTEAGGMQNWDSNPEMRNCTFTGNSAEYSAGMYNYDSNLILEKCSFIGNVADENGGGIYNQLSSCELTECNFTQNSADNGGGMYNSESSLHVSGCTFDTNSADYGGGMFNDFRPSSTITIPTIIQGCTFDSNVGSSKGGGIYNEYAQTVEIINCTLIGNSAEYGGGISNYDSSPAITNCTFNGNTANWGISMYSQEESEPVARNCIFWEDNGVEIVSAFCSPDIAHCVVENPITGGYPITSDIISADPFLEPLADNGGPTWTCALGEGSSAIDAGLTITEISSDQRGAPRPYGDSFDIGAYESGLGFYVITANWSDGGIISPDEAHALENGNEDEVFSIVPDEGYVIDEVLVDGFPDSYDEGNNTYTFEAVSGNHEIYASFVSTEEDDDDDGGGGCNISALPGTGLLLVLPLMFLSGKMK